MDGVADLLQCLALIALAVSLGREWNAVSALQRQVSALNDMTSTMRVWLSALNALIGVESGLDKYGIKKFDHNIQGQQPGEQGNESRECGNDI